MSSRYLTHITLQTGHTRRSWRHEIDAAVWPSITDLLDRALAVLGRDGTVEPWCAVRLHAGLGLWPAAAHWLGDLKRCIAWAWLERVDARRRAA